MYNVDYKEVIGFKILPPNDEWDFNEKYNLF